MQVCTYHKNNVIILWENQIKTKWLYLINLILKTNVLSNNKKKHVEERNWIKFKIFLSKATQKE
jgi:hypothetical protein